MFQANLEHKDRPIMMKTNRITVAVWTILLCVAGASQFTLADDDSEAKDG
jgi:hypothetical protein